MRRKLFRRISGNYYLRLVLSHLLITLITVSIMAAFNYALARNQQNRRMLEVIGLLSRQTARRIETRFEETESISETIRYSLQKLLDNTNERSPQPQLEADEIKSLHTLCDSFHFTDITAWMPETLLSSNEGLTFHNINEPGSRAQTEDVLRAPFNKQCWTAEFDYSYPMMRFGRNCRFNLISCFVRVSTLAPQGTFCTFIDIDEREIAGILASAGEMPVKQYLVDDRGIIVAHPDEACVGDRAPDETLAALRRLNPGEETRIEDQVCMTNTIALNGWMLVTAVPGIICSPSR